MPKAHLIDIGIVIIFFIICLAIGIKLARRQKGFDTFVLADRKLGFLHTLGTMVSTLAGFSIVFAHAILGYKYGVSVYWSTAAVFIAFLVFGFFVPKLKAASEEKNYFTYADMLLDRYDRKTQILGSLLTVLNFLALTAINIYGIGLILSIILGWPFEIAILFGAGAVILYTLLGGFLAVVWTDLLQMIITGIGFLIIMPIAHFFVMKAGGFHANLPADHFGLSTWGLDKIIGTYFVIIPVLFSSQDIWQRVFAAKDVKTGRKAVVAGGALISVAAAIAVYLGMCSRVLLPEINPDYALPGLITHILAPGLVGLLMIAYLAAFTSSADSFLLVISTALAQDFYRSRNKEVDEKKMIRITRFVVAICGVVPILIIMIVPDIVKLLFTVLTWLMILVPATLAGFFWKRTTANAAFWSILVGWLITLVYAIATGDAETAGVVAVVPTVAILVLVSLFSRRSADHDAARS